MGPEGVVVWPETPVAASIHARPRQTARELVQVRGNSTRLSFFAVRLLNDEITSNLLRCLAKGRDSKAMLLANFAWLIVSTCPFFRSCALKRGLLRALFAANTSNGACTRFLFVRE